jgi:hypothetical protein
MIHRSTPFKILRIRVRLGREQQPDALMVPGAIPSGFVTRPRRRCHCERGSAPVAAHVGAGALLEEDLQEGGLPPKGGVVHRGEVGEDTAWKSRRRRDGSGLTWS